ncbi:MAG: HAMP domain-containing histidine kinase [Candidatus Yonathbacteria bacterium]|nr:HAMP domain-containing histidine kinase [Candidatus Yonathbacteria bacterium]
MVIHRGSENIVIASLNTDEVGKDDVSNKALYQTAGLQSGQSFIFEDYVDGLRHWKAVRALTDTQGEVRGFVFLDTSMAYIDDLAARNVRNAYVILFGIIFVIVLLLARQAKVVDYAVLYRKLKDVDQMKDDFVSMAAHELRTPLAVIKGYISMISVDRLTDTDKEGISRVNISVENLNNLVGDILDVVKIDQGRIRFDMKEIDISDTIAEVVDSLQSLAQEKHLTLTFVRSSLSHIDADPVRLKQALINIVGNAIKYTPQGSVSIMATEENGKVSIRVRDTGIGISAEDQKKLFGKFLRIRSKETEDIRGTGLGLWITAQIVSGMKGTIFVESIKWKGSDFILSFPVLKGQTLGSLKV